MIKSILRILIKSFNVITCCNLFHHSLVKLAPMYKYGLSVRFKSTESNRDKLSSILLKASELVSSAKGCQMYLVSLDHEDPETVWTTEIWDSKQDHDDSLKVIGVKELISQAMPLFSAPPEKCREIQIIGGYGINP